MKPPPNRWARLAWLPIPLLLALILGLWVADLRTAHESRVAMVLLNFCFTWLASLCICVLTARGFLASGQPGLLLFGCGSLLWGVTSLAAAAIVDRVNPTVTVHNLGVLSAAACHLAGWLWRGRMARPGRWLAAGYAAALLLAALIFRAATAGWTPVFFVQGHGGTVIRQMVVLTAITLFAGVAWQMVFTFRRSAGRRPGSSPTAGAISFYYWYGLGLGLFATGLTGVLLLTVQGGVLGWTNRLTQYLGSVYLFLAAWQAARQTGSWKHSLAAVEEAWRQKELLRTLRRQPRLRLFLRYGSSVLAVVVALGLYQVIRARVGPGLPPYLLFAVTGLPVMLFAGFWPGVLVTLLTDLVVSYFILPPGGTFHLASPVDRLGMLLYTGVTVFFCVAVELNRRVRAKAAAYDREEALHESQARLASFAAASFEGIVESEAGRIVDCNEQYARMLGYTVAELKGVEIATLVAPEDRDRVMVNIQECREQVIEHAYLRRDGARIIVEAHGRPVSPGSPRRHSAIRDITARKQTEESLRASEQRERDRAQELAAMLEAVPTPVIIVHDSDARHMTGNRAADELVRLSRGAEVSLSAPAELKPAHFKAVKDGRELRLDELPAQRAARGEVVKDFEFNLVFDDGTVRTLLAYGTPLLDAQGQPRGAVHTLVDITARKQAEEALRQAMERHRVLAETMLQGVVHQAADGSIMDMNPAAERILGKTREQFVGSSSVREEHGTIRENGELFPGLEHPSMVALRTGQTVQGVVMGVFNSKLGEYRWIRIDAVPVFPPSQTQASAVYAVFEDITDRKQAEEQLRLSEQRWRLALEVSELGAWELKLADHTAWRSLRHDQIFGYAELLPEWTFEMARQHVLEEDRAEWTRNFERAVAEQQDWNFEARIRRADGAVRWIWAYGKLIRDAAGRPVSMFGLVADITARKQAEEALRESENRFRTMANAMPQLAWIARPDGHIFWYNQRWYEYTGTTPEQMEGWGWQSVHDPVELPKVMERWKASLAKGDPFEMTLPLRGADGNFRRFLTRGFPLKDAAGRVAQWFGTNTDVEELTRAEAALRASEEFNRQTLQALPAHIAVINHAGWIISVNEAWLEFARNNTPPGTPILAVGTQYLEACRHACSRRPAAPERQRGEREKADLVGVQASACPPADQSANAQTQTEPMLGAPPSASDSESAAEALAGIEAVISGAAPQFSMEYPCHSPQEQRWFLMTVAPFGTGSERGAVITHLNITARKQAEAEIRRLNAGLEQRVSERTAQLEAANQELEAFSYSVSHDLRAPLRAVQGFARIIQEDHARQLDAEGNRLFEVVRNEANRMGRLIDDLLAFSRLGRQQAERAQIDMTALARSEFEHQTMVDLSAAPRLDLKPLPPAQGDPAMLRQVFANLLGNAVKFTRHQAAPVIEVGGASENGLNTYYVKDNGVGFDDKYAHRLFGVFQRLHTQSEFEGTGIGLALVQRIIHRHGGQVRAESKPGAGATFYFTLPAGRNL